MKKMLSLFFALAFVCLPLCALAESAPTPNFAPDIAPAPGIVDPIDVPDQQPSTEPGYTSAPSADIIYQSLTNATYKLSMEYPSTWTQIPGRYTICYIEPVSGGQTPARIALTRKTLSSTPNEERITKQLISYLKTLEAQYDTFDVGDLSTDTMFVGQTGYSTEYTGKKGDVSVRGYVIIAAIEKHLYAFHFSASEAAFDSYASVIVHLRDAVKIGE